MSGLDLGTLMLGIAVDRERLSRDLDFAKRDIRDTTGDIGRTVNGMPSLADGLTRGADGALRDLKGRMVTDARSLGDDAGAAAGRAFGDQFDRSANLASRFRTLGRDLSRDALGGLRSIAGSAVRAGAYGLTGAGVAGGYAAFNLGRDAIVEASDLGESLNAVKVTYGQAADEVVRMGQNAATGLGLAQTEFNSLAVRFSAFSKTIGGGNKGSIKVLDDLTTRAADFASVMNLEVNEAAELFQSGLAGETEPLRRFGIDLSAAKVEAFAYAEGIAKTGETLTEAEKVQARYGSLMEQTAANAGDFKNTSDSLANSQRILSARWKNAKSDLGQSLLPAMTGAVAFLNEEGIPAFDRFSDWFAKEGLPVIEDWARDAWPVLQDLGDWLSTDGREGLNDFVDAAGPLVKEILPIMADTLGVARDAALTLAPALTGALEAFNDLPEGLQKGLLVGGGATLAASKFGIPQNLIKFMRNRSGGVGGDGMISRGDTKLNPMYVWVVNNAGGGRGGRSGGGAFVNTDGGDSDKDKKPTGSDDKEDGRRKRTVFTPRGAGVLGMAITALSMVAPDVIPESVTKHLPGGGNGNGYDLLLGANPYTAAAYTAATFVPGAMTAAEAAKDDRFREKWGHGRVMAASEAESGLFRMLGVDTGKGPFGFLRNDEGLMEALYGMSPEELVHTNQALVSEFGVGFKKMAEFGEIDEDFYEWFQPQIARAVNDTLSLRGVLDDLPSSVVTTVTVDIEQAKRQAAQFSSDILEFIQSPFGGGESPTGGNGRRAGSGDSTPRGFGSSVRISMPGREFSGYIEDTADAAVVAERERYETDARTRY